MEYLSKSLSQDMMRRIITGEYPEGAYLPNEEELCEQLGVSRVVVREAKKRLQALGMIRPRKKAGSYVLPRGKWNFFSRDLFSLYLESGSDADGQLENFYAMRLLLEPEAAATTARKHSDAFIREMHDVLYRLERIDKGVLQEDLLTLDLEFHIRIYEETDNILLMPMANLMKPLFLYGFRFSNSEWEMGFPEHMHLLQAIERRDEADARECAALLVRNGRDRFRREQARSKDRVPSPPASVG